jgi:hypothetical protein
MYSGMVNSSSFTSVTLFKHRNIFELLAST